jgi:DNA-binding IclR family transcriptional regulator
MEPKLPRRLLRRLETPGFPLITLGAIKEARDWLEGLEERTIGTAREMGASVHDMADALGLSRQGIYRRLHDFEQRGAAEPEPGTQP